MTRTTALTALLLTGIVPATTEIPLTEPPVLFRSVQVFDGDRILSARDVLVVDGKIVRMGERIPVPEGARIVQGQGRTLMPGLIDSHTHAFGNALEEALVFGVTTELDMFSPVTGARNMRAQLTGPAGPRMADLRTAVTVVTAPGGHGTEYGFPIPTIERPEDAQAFVDARIAEGSDYIKIIYDDGHAYGMTTPTISNATLGAVIEAAHRRDKLAVVHIGGLSGARAALEAGADGLVHLFVDSMPDPAFGQLTARHHAFVVPTLSVLQSVAGLTMGARLAEDSALAPYILPTSNHGLAQTFPVRVPVYYGAATAAVRLLKAANVPILAGTDAGNPGTGHGMSLHGELELLVQAGLTPLEALRAATSAPAKAFGLTDRGRIAPGMRADLVLVEGNPSQDIRMTRRIVGVWKAGIALDRNHWREQAAEARMAAAKGAEVPPGLEAGAISDFDDGTDRAAFGAGWGLSTDQIAGGKSIGEIKVLSGGADGSAGSLQVSGTIDPGLPYAWSGAMFSPGAAPLSPTDLSSKRGIRFWARGDGKTYRIMVFSQSRGEIPLRQTFVAGDEWKEYVFTFSSFSDFDGKDVAAFLWVGGPEGGTFDFQIDGVRLE